MKYMTKAASEIASSDSSLTNNNNNIDWNNFNYPVCVKLYHYDPSETPEIHKRKVSLFKLNHLLIILSTILNFVTNIINTATGYEYYLK